MKKLFIVASVIAISTVTAFASETITKPPVKQEVSHNQVQPVAKTSAMKKLEFDKRLNLTEEQIKKANDLKAKSKAKIKPLMEQIKAKHIELANLRNKDISEYEKIAKSQALKNEINKLDAKVQKLRLKNMEDFEKILTKEQKQELAKMKAEGRRNFAKNHPPTPFGYDVKAPAFGGHKPPLDFDKGFPPPPPDKIK